MVVESTFSMKYLHQYISVMAGALTFFVVGNQVGSVSPYLEKLSSDGYHEIEKISDLTRTMLTSVLTLGILPGAFIASYANDILGRKYSMVTMTIFALLTPIFQYFAVHIVMVFVNLALRGLIIAWSFSVVPTYISEVSSPHLRGPFTVFCILFGSIGGLSGSVIQASLTIDFTAIITGAEIFVIVLVTLCFVSETPYYFITKNQDEKCKQAFRKFHYQENVDKEFEEMKSAWNGSLKAKQVGWTKIFKVRSNLKLLIICAGVQTIQQFTGHIVMNANIHTVVKNSGLNLTLTQISVLTHGVGIIATVLSIFVVDSWGRRPLLMFVCIGACIGHFITGLGFLIADLKGETTTALGLMELTGNLIYLAMAGLGLVHLPNVLGAELFPTDIKSKGCSLLMIVSSFEGVLVSLSFDLLSKIAYYLPFWIMAVCAILGLIFVIIWVPETKNRSLEDIQRQLSLVDEEVSKTHGF